MKALYALIFAGLTSASIGHAGPNAAVLDHLAKQVITQTYVDLATDAQTLSTKIDALSAQPSQENLTAAQDAWRNMRVAWESSEAFLFGPVEALGIDPAIDTWPLNKLDLDSVLNSGRALTPDFVRNLGANMQGFHTLEYLLFGPGETTNNKDIAQVTARQLEYMRSTAIVLAQDTARLARAWTTNYNPDVPSTPGYSQIVAKPNPENPVYPSEQAVLVELVNGMLGIIDEVGNGKMSDPLGANLGSANVNLVESPFSWNSLTDFTNNIGSVLNVYTGDYGSAHGPGVRDVIARVDPTLATQVEQAIRHAMQSIQDVAGPEHIAFRQAILDPNGRTRVQAAIADLNSLHELIRSRVLPIVGR